MTKMLNPDIYERITPSGAEILRRHAISCNSNVREALHQINTLSGESMTLFVIDPYGCLVGTVTDGDIRRALISGAELSDAVESVMHRAFLSLLPGEDCWLTIAECRKRHIALLPVVDKGHITDILDLRTMKTRLPIDAVLMAGGRGERLRPLTLTTPKPLLPVGGKAIIDYNVDELERCGVDRIFVTVNYLADKIEEHFGKRRGRVEITCIREPKRLGTMGSLALVEGLESSNVLMMNSDILTTIDFEKLSLQHKKTGADLTMGAVPYTVSVPFAIMKMDGGKVKGLEEKPTYNYFANGGVYLMRRALLDRIVRGEYLDAPDFISALIADGGSVGCFPIEGTWIDIGSPDDYRYANDLMKRKTF